MDKIARVRQEIERRLNILTNVYAEQVERKDEEMMNYYHGKVIALEELRPFLDTLSEEPDKSLEEAVEKHINEALFKWSYDDEDGIEQYVHDSFIAGAEWQKEQDERVYREFFNERNQGDASFRDLLAYKEGHRDGMEEQKDQMLKGAVEAEVDWYDGPRLNYSIDQLCEVMETMGVDVGDKVRIIIIKED